MHFINDKFKFMLCKYNSAGYCRIIALSAFQRILNIVADYYFFKPLSRINTEHLCSNNAIVLCWDELGKEDKTPNKLPLFIQTVCKSPDCGQFARPLAPL